MITCQHARHLFDSYLDGELSASLQTELHAHRLNCTACQNELALLEACGDVIAMDRREPQIGASFTDRVLMAQRGRQLPRRRRWGRVAWLVGSPMAAAASVAFMLSVVTPALRTAPKTAVDGKMDVAPLVVRDTLLKEAGREATATEKREWTDQGHEMTVADLMQAWRDDVKGFRQTTEELRQHLVRTLPSPNEKLLAAFAQTAQKEKTAAAAGSDRADFDVDPSDPSYLNQPAPAPDSAAESDRSGPV